MPCRHRPGELIPIAALPAVVPRRRSAHHRGVGHTPGHDDIRTLLQRVDDSPATEVGIGCQKVRAVADRLAGLEVSQLAAGNQVRQPRHEVVAAHVRDLRSETELVGDFRNRVGAAVGIETTGVGNDLDTALQAGTHDLFHLRHEGARIATARTLHPRPRQNQHGELGEPIAGQHIDRPTLDHLTRRRNPVAVEPGAIRYPNGFGHFDFFSHR